MTRMASFVEWEQFLRPLTAAVRNPPSRDDFKAKCAACADSLAIPAEWLTPHRRREITARFEFFPSVREVDDFFADDKRHQMDMAAYRDRSGYLAAPEPPPPLTEEQKAAALAQAAAFKAEMAERTQRDAPKATPRHLSQPHLLAYYERLAAQGNAAAAVRVQTLRAQGVTV